MTQFVRRVVARERTVSQADEDFHNVGLLGGPTNNF